MIMCVGVLSSVTMSEMNAHSLWLDSFEGNLNMPPLRYI